MLLVRRERHQRRGGNFGGNSHRRFGYLPSAFRQCDGASTAVLRIGERGHKAAQMQPVDDTLDRRGIKIDQPAEVVLRAWPYFIKFGEGCKLRLREPLDHA